VFGFVMSFKFMPRKSEITQPLYGLPRAMRYMFVAYVTLSLVYITLHISSWFIERSGGQPGFANNGAQMSSSGWVEPTNQDTTTEQPSSGKFQLNFKAHLS
jgi:hypothetical protein